MGYLKRLGDKRRSQMAYVVTINVTTREITEGNPPDVRKVQIVESKGEGSSPEKAFHGAYENSGLREYVELLQGMPKIVKPFGEAS